MLAHGTVSFSWEKDLFIVYVNGPFNVEGIAHYSSLIQDSILNRKNSSWRRLEILNDEALSSPDGIDLVIKMYTWYEENGCNCAAVVVSNRVQANIFESKFNQKIKVFSEITKAKEWLETHNTY